MMWVIFVSVTMNNHIIAEKNIANQGLNYWKLKRN